MISAANLNITLGDTEILHDVSVDFSPGTFSLLIGPSGSGKTTLLAILSGLRRPDAGMVTAVGHDLWSLTDRQREDLRLHYFGFVFQGDNLFPALTARQQLEIVLCWGLNQPPEVAAQPVAAMLDFLGLGNKHDLLPQQLSGGERQRLAVGRALIKNPMCCFADEPTSALDWGRGKQVVELLSEAANNGTMVLAVSHDQRLIPYAHQVLRLQDGVLTRLRS